MREVSPLRSLQQYMDGRTAIDDPPGAAWCAGLVGTDPVPGYSGSAAAEPDREPLQPATVFDLASLTKPLATAVVAVILEQDGLLDLESPLAELLPESRGSRYCDATLLDLGAHQAGLPAWAPIYAMEENGSHFPYRILALPPGAEPGRTLYSDLGYILLGHVLEVVTGKSLDRLFAQRVAGPLGLDTMIFPGRTGIGRQAAATERGNRFERDLAGERAAGYSFREGMIRGQVHDGNAWAMGGVAGHAGLFGSLDDVIALACEILAPARLELKSRARRRLLEPVKQGGRTFGFQPAALSSAASSILPDTAPGHTGFTGTSLWLHPETGRYWVLLTNRVHPVAGAAGFQAVRREFHRLSADPIPE
ncbi:MAG: beta-lactamase family protein [Acidobacteria bacterium]|uniref:Beta-lactamase family protein n=1 Tax=Candidatus Polarisedimenticola svalbardensis TaxID=2886004 RepID=A0A8J6Y718_9BACT|nr:beta-lactamase family protein [Candidatus Polarisedimenticola svalbardensis]